MVICWWSDGELTSVLCSKQDFGFLWSLKESVLMSVVVSKIELKIYFVSQKANCVSSQVG